MMGRLFGTDGARGIANTELTCELAMQIGRAAAVVLTKETAHKPKIVIARDTRISSEMLEAALAAGLCSVGANAVILGVIPTPAASYLVSRYGADAGVMISASHNPVEFNGIKLFASTGYKLPDALEEQIEELILDHPEKIERKSGTELGRISVCHTAVQDYISHLLSKMDVNLSGMTVALDCANGSASATARAVFSRLGAEVHMLNDQPDGTNINKNCGSTHMDALARYVAETPGLIGGFAFDGDADRCLAVDENGCRIDGDQIIAAFARQMKAENRLSADTAVVTVMSNFGMRDFGRREGVRIVQTAVGDRYVLEEMLKNSYNLGGEDSGHIILSDYANTGDGQLTALQMLRICKKTGKPLSEIASAMQKSPQVLRSVRASAEDKKRYMQIPAVADVIREAEEALGEDGRVLVRASGTEPLIRVMLEGSDAAKIETYCIKICKTIEENIG